MNTTTPTLIDENAQPPLRALLGRLLARATTADFAIRRIRLAGIDLSAAELGPLQSCRVLVGRLDASTLHDIPIDAPARAAALQRLLRFSLSGRLLVRAAPATGWNPDFSILHRNAEAGPGFACCIIGSHYFYEPDPPDGPAFTTVMTGPAAVRLARRRFDRLWDQGYDVLPAVQDALRRMLTAFAN